VRKPHESDWRKAGREKEEFLMLDNPFWKIIFAAEEKKRNGRQETFFRGRKFWGFLWPKKMIASEK